MTVAYPPKPVVSSAAAVLFLAYGLALLTGRFGGICAAGERYRARPCEQEKDFARGGVAQ
jgi:hypothetical protein